MSVANQAFSALQRIGIVILIAIAFLLGLGTTVYLSLRSPEVTVPEVIGKDRFEAEKVLGNAGLNFRVRATRPSNQVRADTVLFQLPRAGEVVKAGQTVAMDISRTAKAGEVSEAIITDRKASDEKAAASGNKNESATSRNDNENRQKRNKNTNKNDSAKANAGNRDAAVPNRNGTENSDRVNANSVNVNSRGSGATGNANSSSNTNQRENPPRPPEPGPSPTAPKP